MGCGELKVDFIFIFGLDAACARDANHQNESAGTFHAK
jgi:hypothetical protein